MKGPILDKQLNEKTFRSFYYLKEELVDFCRTNGLPASGGKIEITDRIAYFLCTGNILPTFTKSEVRPDVGVITEDAPIEPDFVCSEKIGIGKRFSFNVAFQKCLKSNTGKTYGAALEAYDRILEEKKKGNTKIDKQFEYNTYIRDFFVDNEGRSLEEAIQCWKYKKGLQGHHRYEKSDLIALL